MERYDNWMKNLFLTFIVVFVKLFLIKVNRKRNLIFLCLLRLVKMIRIKEFIDLYIEN